MSIYKVMEKNKSIWLSRIGLFISINEGPKDIMGMIRRGTAVLRRSISNEVFE